MNRIMGDFAKSIVLVGLLLSTAVVGQSSTEKEVPQVISSTDFETTTGTSDNEIECNCTPFNLCKSFVAKEDGNNLIDIRVNMAPPCLSYMDVCCNDDKNSNTDEKNHENSNTDEKNDKNLNTDEKHDKNPNTDEKNDKNSSTDEKHETTGDTGGDDNNTHCPCQSTDKTESVDNKKAPNDQEHEKKPNDKEHESKPYDNEHGDKPDDKEHESKPIDKNDKKPYDKQDENDKKPHDKQDEKPYKPEENHSIGPGSGLAEEPSLETTTTVNEHNISDKPDDQEPKCGQWNKDGVGFRIVNAVDGESQYGEYPSMVAIFVEDYPNDPKEKHTVHCGGSLIKKNVVLTAAHCVIKKNIKHLVIRAGDWDLETEKEVYSHQDRRVSKMVTHPDYYAGGLHSDVALLFTDEPFYMQENVHTICLPDHSELFDHDRCFSCGWGKTVSYNNYTIYKKNHSGSSHEIGKYQVSILKKVEVPVIPREKCTAALRRTRLGPKFVLHESFMCAGGEEGKDTCRGDGGGPLMCPSKNDARILVQVGIVAWGIQCGLPEIPAVYVDVASFRNWIDKEIETHALSYSKETH